MAHWQLFLTILLFWSLFGSYEPSYTYSSDTPDAPPPKTRLQGFIVSRILQCILAWFVSGWLLPIVNSVLP